MNSVNKHKRVCLSVVLITLIVIMAVALVGCAPNKPELPAISKTSFTAVSRDSLEVLTAPQAAQKAMPSLVGVLNYANSTDMSPQSEGSGIIMSQDGYIITNAHVVEGAAIVKIICYDGTVYTATNKDISSDNYTDLALVKIDAKGLTPAEFGKSSELLIAEDVMAIGNPGGLQYSFSVTKGIVSSLNRQYEPLSGSGYYINTIQTDAAINPGNSGGALINMYGQVVGINSAKIADVNVEGMGFSIAIDDAKSILDELLNNGYVSGRVGLGVVGGLVNATIKEDGVTKTITGLYVQSISNSSLTENGVKEQTIITQVNGVDVNSSGAVASALKGKGVGDKVTIKVYSLGERYGSGYYSYYNATSKEVKITLIELKPN